MLYCIVQAEDGRLVSVTADLAKVADEKTLAARGYLVVERPPEEAGGIWDVARKQFTERPAPPPPFRDPPDATGTVLQQLVAMRGWAADLKRELVNQGVLSA